MRSGRHRQHRRRWRLAALSEQPDVHSCWLRPVRQSDRGAQLRLEREQCQLRFDQFFTGAFTAGTLARTFNGAIQATASGVTGTTSVTVTPCPLDHIAVIPANPYVPVNGTQAYVATGFDQYDNPRTGDTFSWSVTDAGTGAINASTGVLTAGSGEATFANVVPATYGDVTGTASVRVINGNVMNGSVTLQGGGRTGAGRAVSVTVKLFSTGTSNANLASGTGALATLSASRPESQVTPKGPSWSRYRSLPACLYPSCHV